MAKRLIRREHHRRTGEPLKGFALDLTIIAPERGIFFLHDRFGQTNPVPIEDAEDVWTALGLVDTV